MVKRFALALILGMASPVYAGGSMAPDVKVIVVHPTPEHRNISRIKKIEKDRQAETKAQGKAAAQALKNIQAAQKAWNKDYEARQKARLKKK